MASALREIRINSYTQEPNSQNTLSYLISPQDSVSATVSTIEDGLSTRANPIMQDEDNDRKRLSDRALERVMRDILGGGLLDTPPSSGDEAYSHQGTTISSSSQTHQGENCKIK
jgi:glucose-6-phosphate 1-dehydrogenase